MDNTRVFTPSNNRKEVYNHFLESIANSFLKKYDIEDIDLDLIYSDTDYNLTYSDSTIVLDIISDKYFKSCDYSHIEWEELA